MLKIDLKRLTLDKVADEFAKANIGKWGNLKSVNGWLIFVEIATDSIARLVRKEKYSKLIKRLGYAFGWLCCFVKVYSQQRPEESFRFLSDLSEMVWRKFPGMCYACAHNFMPEVVGEKGNLACVCLATPLPSPKEKKTREERLESARENKTCPSTIDDWANMIKKIYGPNHRLLSLSAICLHFLEESGEVAQRLRELRELPCMVKTEERKKKILELEEEIADVFSWIFGLLNKLDQILEESRRHYKKKFKLPVLKASDVFYETLREWKKTKIP